MTILAVMLLSHFVMVGTVLAQNTTKDEERDAVPVDREQLERAATTAIENGGLARLLK